MAAPVATCVGPRDWHSGPPRLSLPPSHAAREHYSTVPVALTLLTGLNAATILSLSKFTHALGSYSTFVEGVATLTPLLIGFCRDDVLTVYGISGAIASLGVGLWVTREGVLRHNATKSIDCLFSLVLALS